MADRLNQSVLAYGPGPVKREDGYWYWPDGSPVNVRRNNGHSRSARAAASARVAQQIRRNGRPQTQAEIQDMYETAQEEVNAEMGTSCEVLNSAEFATIHQILVDASNLQFDALTMAHVASLIHYLTRHLTYHHLL